MYNTFWVWLKSFTPFQSDWNHGFCGRTELDTVRRFRWGPPAMDHVLVGDVVVDQPVGHQYVVTFPRMSKSAPEPVSPFTSSVDWSYLVYRPEGHEDGRGQPTIPAAADYTNPHRCWRDLHPHACCGVDLLSEPNQRSIRGSRHGQPFMPCLLIGRVH